MIEKVRNNSRQGFVQIEDFQAYPPAYGTPVMFLATPIYNGAYRVGIMVIQLSVEGINQILTNNQDWEKVGLGQTREVYLVGSDLLMRSASRFQIQQPEAYYNQLVDQGVSPQTLQLIRRFDSPILLQPEVYVQPLGSNNQQYHLGGLSQPSNRFQQHCRHSICLRTLAK